MLGGLSSCSRVVLPGAGCSGVAGWGAGWGEGEGEGGGGWSASGLLGEAGPGVSAAGGSTTPGELVFTSWEPVGAGNSLLLPLVLG